MFGAEKGRKPCVKTNKETPRDQTSLALPENSPASELQDSGEANAGVQFEK